MILNMLVQLFEFKDYEWNKIGPLCDTLVFVRLDDTKCIDSQSCSPFFLLLSPRDAHLLALSRRS